MCRLYEEYPSRYSADVSRRRRWIRGDWQIAQWVLPGVPGPDARLQKNPLSMLSRWKIFDNLRRSLVPAALTLLLLLGWTVLPSAWFWTLSVIGIILIPSLISLVLDVLQKPGDVTLGQHLAATVRSAGRHFAQAAIYARVSPLRGILQSGCDCAHGLALADHAQAASRMEPVERPGSQWPH